MIWQLHWQHKDSEKTDFVAQRDINSQEEMKLFVKETVESHSIPDNAIWMACNEESKHFLLMEDEDKEKG